MLDDFFIRALLAGVGVAAVAGPLGCFVVWRRMSYFGDTMAHAALLGIALGLLAELDPTLGILAVTVAVAMVLLVLDRLQRFATDTLLGILAHSSLAIGLVVLSLMTWLRVDLFGYLFGDILAVRRIDLLWIYLGGAFVLGVLIAIWRTLLAATVDEDLARAEGLPVPAARIVFMLLIAIVIAISMKIVGVLLITSLLIIPAATARRLATGPEAMAVIAAVCGVAAALAGLGLSRIIDTPSGPSVVVAALALFVASLVPLPGIRPKDPPDEPVHPIHDHSHQHGGSGRRPPALR